MQKQAVLILAVAALFWGTSFYPTTLILSKISELEYLIVRFVLASVAFFILRFRYVLASDKRCFFYGSFVGILMGIAFFTQTLAFSGTNSSMVAFLTSTTIIFVPILSLICFKILPSKRGLLAAMIALIGLYLLSGAAIYEGSKGELLALSCALFFGAQISLSEHALKSCELNAFVFWQFCAASVFLCCCVPFYSNGFDLSKLDYLSLAFCLYGALVLTVFCFFAQNYAQQHLSAAKVALLLALEPLSAGLLGALMGESFSFSAYTGAFLIIVGVIFS